MIEFFVPGKPAPQGSKTRFPNGGMRESSAAVGPWRRSVALECRRAVSDAEASGAGGMILAGEAAEVRAVFVLARPAAHYGTGRNSRDLKASAPDRPPNGADSDKLARAVLDGIVAGGAIADDRQVADLPVCKVYALLGQPAGVAISIAPARPVQFWAASLIRRTMEA